MIDWDKIIGGYIKQKVKIVEVSVLVGKPYVKQPDLQVLEAIFSLISLLKG